LPTDTHTYTLTAWPVFHDSLCKLVPECQTIPGVNATIDDGSRQWCKLELLR